MPRPPRRTGPWLAVAWVAGTATAVLISVVAVNLAGSKVTARPISTVSRSGVEQALAGDATVLVRDHSSEVASDGLGSDHNGGSGSGSGDSSGDGSRSGSGGSSSASGSHDGGSGGDSGSGGASGGSSGSDGGSGGSSGGSGGGSDDGRSTTTTAPEQGGTTTTTAVPSSPVSRTVSGNTVTVRCTGDTIALLSATAASGFSKQVDKSGPDEVRVQFVDERTDAEIEVQASCSHGSVIWD